jgi:hypothetical protein
MEHLPLAASESVCLLAHHDISLAAEFGRYRGIADSGQPNDL